MSLQMWMGLQGRSSGHCVAGIDGFDGGKEIGLGHCPKHQPACPSHGHAEGSMRIPGSKERHPRERGSTSLMEFALEFSLSLWRQLTLTPGGRILCPAQVTVAAAIWGGWAADEPYITDLL